MMSNLVRPILAAVTAVMLLAVGAVPGAAQEDLSHQHPTQIVANSDVPVIGSALPAGQAWQIDDGAEDHVAPNGIPVGGFAPWQDVDVAWTTVVELNRRQRRAIRAELDRHAPHSWGQELPLNQPVIVSVVRMAGQIDCDATGTRQVWTMGDGPNSVPATATRAADPANGARRMTASGSSGNRYGTQTTDTKGTEPGERPDLGNAKPRDVGACVDGDVIINLTPAWKNTTSSRHALAVGTDRGLFFDYYGPHGDLSTTPHGTPVSGPEVVCFAWVALPAVQPPSESEASAESQSADASDDGQGTADESTGRLQLRMIRPSAVGAALEDTRGEVVAMTRFLGDTILFAPSAPSGSDPGSEEPPPEVPTELFRIGRSLEAVIATADTVAGAGELHRLPEPLTEAPEEVAALPVLIQPDDQGDIHGDGRCATWQYPGFACDKVDGEGLVGAAGALADRVDEEGFVALTHSQVCNIHVDGDPKPMFVVKVEEDLYAPGSHLSEPHAEDCVQEVVVDGNVIVLTCGHGQHTRIIRQAAPLSVASAADVTEPPELRVSFDVIGMAADSFTDVELTTLLDKTADIAESFLDEAEVFTGLP